MMRQKESVSGSKPTVICGTRHTLYEQDYSMTEKDNVVYLNNVMKLSTNPVPVLCEIAGGMLKDVLILGEDEDGTIKMITTQPDTAELLFYLKSAEYALMAGGMDEDDGDYN